MEYTQQEEEEKEEEEEEEEAEAEEEDEEEEEEEVEKEEKEEKEQEEIQGRWSACSACLKGRLELLYRLRRFHLEDLLALHELLRLHDEVVADLTHQHHDAPGRVVVMAVLPYQQPGDYTRPLFSST